MLSQNVGKELPLNAA